ncbi:hypothetical protein GF377_05645 [candidate division GN15 bacterium]|nr:hypothetical protein [candidate division GN15 bacterium]
MKRFKNRIGFALGLNVLCPGLGHVYSRDTLFGVFVFLIALLTSVVFFVSLIIDLPLVVKLILFGLPLLFYIATFFDLHRSIRKRRVREIGRLNRSGYTALVFLAVGVIFQLLAPVAPGNYLLRNAPVVFTTSSNDFSPVLSRGELACASALGLRSEIFFLDRPVWHRLPDRGTLVRFANANNQMKIGVVLGHPYDAVEVVDGVLFIDGELQRSTLVNSPLTNGDVPLTTTDAGSILVATLKLGDVDSVLQVSLRDVTGSVAPLF